ncbi:MAG TPA: hypothetical protein VM183_12290 [Burkholderiales bacterium]|nr:hypothetical protein [Burkholderiales bacterium]
MASTIHSRVLRSAAEVLGGIAALCRHLQVPEAVLNQWLLGLVIPSTHVFLKAVDVLVVIRERDPSGESAVPFYERQPAGSSAGARRDTR